jgi:nucleotide-binding universal stress UspA family protein
MDQAVLCPYDFSQEHTMRRILVPLDGSGMGEAAMILAGGIAARIGGELELVTVNGPVAHPDIGAAIAAESEAARGVGARAYLEERAEELRRRHGIAVRTAVLDGSAGGAIAEHARREGVELIVMSTHGRSGPSRLLLGSVADELLHEVDCPLVVVRAPLTPGEIPAEPRVLVPLDGSTLAESVVDEVARLLPPELTTLHLLRVVAPAEVFPVGAPMPLPAMEPNDMEARLAAAARYLEATAAKLRAAGWRVEREVAMGWNPAAAALRSAETSRCDLIAIATRGRGGVQRMLLGSVADKVLRCAAVPVLVLNPGAGACSSLLGEEPETASLAGAVDACALQLGWKTGVAF